MVCSCDSPVIPLGLVNDLAKHLDQTVSSAAYPIVDGDHIRLLLLLEVETAIQAMRQTLDEFCESPANLSVKHWLKRLITSTVPLSGGGIALKAIMSGQRPMRPLALIQRIMLPMQAPPRQRAAPPNHHST